jgi:energy-coupling factor transporter ATP-binding protein EcfA2
MAGLIRHTVRMGKVAGSEACDHTSTPAPTTDDQPARRAPVTALVRIEDLAAGYGSRTVLTDVTVDVQRGERIAVLGPNGGARRRYSACSPVSSAPGPGRCSDHSAAPSSVVPSTSESRTAASTRASWRPLENRPRCGLNVTQASLSVRTPRGTLAAVDCQTLGIVLTVAGGTSELAGVGLVVRGIISDRVKARKLFSVVKVRASSARAYARAGAVMVSGGREPTTPERVEALESTVAALRQEMDDRLFEARKASDAQIDQALAQAYAADKEIDGELRAGLADVLAGDVRGRVAGVVLLVLGIVLSVAGNWIGALS